MSFFGMFDVPEKLQAHPGLRSPSTEDTYRAILKELSAGKKNRIIENDTFDDSVAVYERFFLDCKDEIRIMARGIKTQILDRAPVLHAVSRFLDRPASVVRLDLRAHCNADVDTALGTEFVRTIQQGTNNTGRFIANFYKSDPETEWLPDLASVTLGDDRMFRIRRAQENGNYNTTANADVNFNDPDRVSNLSDRIDAALEKEEKFTEVIY